MNYIGDIKLKMVVDNDTEVHICDVILNNIELIYNTDPYTNNFCVIIWPLFAMLYILAQLGKFIRNYLLMRI